MELPERITTSSGTVRPILPFYHHHHLNPLRPGTLSPVSRNTRINQPFLALPDCRRRYLVLHPTETRISHPANEPPDSDPEPCSPFQFSQELPGSGPPHIQHIFVRVTLLARAPPNCCGRDETYPPHIPKLREDWRHRGNFSIPLPTGRLFRSRGDFNHRCFPLPTGRLCHLYRSQHRPSQ